MHVATEPSAELDQREPDRAAAPRKTVVGCRGDGDQIETSRRDDEASHRDVARLGGTPTSAGRRTVWWTTLVVCAVGVALARSEWVPRGWTREDGPIESAGFACFLVASVLAFVAAHLVRPARRPALAALALGAVLFVVAGEEISWGQRLVGMETPEVLADRNRQDELNIHNIDGLQQRVIFGQLAVAGAGVLLPRFVRRPWAWSGLPFFAGYLAYRGARGVGVLIGWDAAGKNAEAAEFVLALGLLALTAQLVADLRRARAQPPASTGPPVSPYDRPADELASGSGENVVTTTRPT